MGFYDDDDLDLRGAYDNAVDDYVDDDDCHGYVSGDDNDDDDNNTIYCNKHGYSNCLDARIVVYVFISYEQTINLPSR